MRTRRTVATAAAILAAALPAASCSIPAPEETRPAVLVDSVRENFPRALATADIVIIGTVTAANRYQTSVVVDEVLRGPVEPGDWITFDARRNRSHDGDRGVYAIKNPDDPYLVAGGTQPWMLQYARDTLQRRPTPPAATPHP